MTGIVLRDIHQPPAPSWWPPAPGWWLIAIALLGAVAWWWWRRRQRERKRLAIASLFDRTLEAATTSADQVAAMSELLRRAARRVDASADRMQGEAWLEFLDRPAPGGKRKRPIHDKAFAQGAGRLLLDGGYRREVEPEQVEALRALARQRFLQWMGAT